MLVLSRKIGERICIDGGIEVVVLAIHGNRIRLGIEAPQTVPIHRSELLEQVEQVREYTSPPLPR